MKWKTTKENKDMTALVGQCITNVEIDSVDNNIKSIVITTEHGALRFAIDCYSFAVSIPQLKYTIVGDVTVNGTLMHIDPEEFDNLAKAQKRLDELQNGFDADFKGEILTGR